MGSKKLCQRFLKTEEKICPTEHLHRYMELIREHHLTGSYGMAVGLYIKDNRIDLEKALSELHDYAIPKIFSDDEAKA